MQCQGQTSQEHRAKPYKLLRSPGELTHPLIAQSASHRLAKG